VISSSQLKMLSHRQQSSQVLSPIKLMSTQPPPFDRATGLFISGLDESIDPVVVRYRPVAINGVGVVDLIRDAGLNSASVFDGCEV